MLVHLISRITSFVTATDFSEAITDYKLRLFISDFIKFLFEFILLVNF